MCTPFKYLCPAHQNIERYPGDIIKQGGGGKRCAVPALKTIVGAKVVELAMSKVTFDFPAWVWSSERKLLAPIPPFKIQKVSRKIGSSSFNMFVGNSLFPQMLKKEYLFLSSKLPGQLKNLKGIIPDSLIQYLEGFMPSPQTMVFTEICETVEKRFPWLKPDLMMKTEDIFQTLKFLNEDLSGTTGHALWITLFCNQWNQITSFKCHLGIGLTKPPYYKNIVKECPPVV